MGNAEATIQRNGVSYKETTQYRQQPPWAYYSQVSVASPQSRIASRESVGVFATRDTSPKSPNRSDVTPLRTSVTPPSGEVLEVPRKCEPKQWGPWSLTQRELEVIQLLAEGATNSEISERLFISPKTTKNHLAAIFQKLDVTNRTQALVRAVVMGLVSIE
jgi:DNA-binding CsgD family transcriptional regulator